MFEDNDELMFSDSETEETEHNETFYKILIVDDEESVHELTLLALKYVRFNDRGLEILHAYSAAEAEVIIAKESDLAVILLDVVMESDSAGLDLVKTVREKIKNHIVRIILRTGQPGQAPENEVILNYDINDYKNKTELTVEKLFSSMITALRSYNDLVRIEKSKHALAKVLESTSSLVKFKSIDKFFCGLLEQVVYLMYAEPSVYKDDLSAYLGFYSRDKLYVELGTGIFDDIATRKKIIEVEYKDKIEKILENHEKYKEKDSLLFYHKNSDMTALLILFKGNVDAIDVDDDLFDLFIKNASITFDNLILVKDVKRNQKDTIYKLSEVAEQRSEETGYHVKRVAYFAKEIGEELGLNPIEVDELFSAAPMHDIGKIGIRDGVLKKPGSLTPEEFEEMKLHSVRGYELLHTSDKELLKASAIIAHEHHEHFDGNGYPRGLAGDEIHIFARITALCDVFDALSSKRIYKEAWPMDEVLEFIKKERGKQFDPNIVDAFFIRLEKILILKERFKD